MSTLPSLVNVNASSHQAPDDLSISPSRIHNTDAPKKQKKKRGREDIHEADDAREVKERKKKKHKRHIEEVTDGMHFSQTQSHDPEPSKQKKPKKKQKAKGKQPESIQPEFDTNLSSPNTQASATALMSAIAAASASSATLSMESQQLLEPHFDQAMLPNPSHQPFMPYPFMPLGYGTVCMPPNAMSLSSLFPTPTNLPFSDLVFASNDDVLRALQALDMSKITNALKNLGDTMAPSDSSGSLIHPGPSPLGQVPITSGTILGILPDEQATSMDHGRRLDMSLPGTEHQTSPDHAYLLANKWLNASKLAAMVKTEGLIYKKGKFSAIEEQQLKDAIEHYRIAKQLTEEQMRDLIYPKSDKSRDNAFWSEITTAVPQRPIIAVYHHVRRTYHPLKRLGPWTPPEDAELKRAVTDLGQQWEKVSQVVGRMSSDCRDRYRNHIVDREVRVSGPWTKQEEEELTRIVTDMTVKQGKDADNDVFWGRVSELMGNKRGRQQCRIKWTDALSKTFKNEGQKPRWSQQDAYILVHKVDSLNVRDDTEIDWKTISDPQWNLWSAHTLQRRWLTMKRSVKGHEEMTHREIMDILRIKKAQMPISAPAAVRKRKERKVTSAASIAEDSPASTPGAGSVIGQTVFENSGNIAVANNESDPSPYSDLDD